MNLREYFISAGISINRFAKEHGIHRSLLYRAMQGGDIRLSTALKIAEATGGVVSVEKLVSKT